MAATLNYRKALLVLNGLKHVGTILLRRLLDAIDQDPVAILADVPYAQARDRWLV